jgi:pimeloyl-ACP methyl ester carboxylesterase
VPIVIDLGNNPDDAELTVTIDGEVVTLSRNGNRAEGNAANVAQGTHQLEATTAIDGSTAAASLTFEAVAIANPDECEILNAITCLLPYPSSRFLEPADTATGFRLKFPLSGMPRQRSRPFPVEPFLALDGFSPTAPIAMYFNGGVDAELSNASRLLADTLTHDLRSLDTDSPSVLIDATTGERILHFLQPDVRARRDGVPEQEVLILHPSQSLIPGHRYIVAMRDLVSPDGEAVVAEPIFAALRDGRTTTINAVETRRPQMEALFAELGTYGVERGNLLLAWDFAVASDQSLTGQMLHMRDESFAWLANTDALQTFTVERVFENDCDVAGTRIWRRIEGTFQSPLYLKADPLIEPTNTATFNLDEEGNPVADGFTNPPFTIAVPCTVLDEESPPVHPIVLGHGLFGDGRDFVRQLSETTEIQAFNYIAGATDWTGLAALDADIDNIVSSFVGRVALDQPRNFPALPDRLRQGQLNTLLLARMMKNGDFNVDAAFQRPDGSGVFPGAEVEEFYFGASLGGIMGLMFAALSPDVTNVHVDVPAINFAFLLPRSIAFIPFEAAIILTGVNNKIEQTLLLVLTHELWSRAESAGYATHITENPLPGTNAKNVLISGALYDQLVSNQATEITARTLKVPSLVGSVLPERPLIPDLEGPLSSALVMYDTGVFDPSNPAHVPFIPPLANVQPVENGCDPHRRQAFTPVAIEQLFEFLRPDGEVVNFCNGLCDAGEAAELPYGGLRPCDPL